MTDAFGRFIAVDWSGAAGAYDGIALARCEAGTAPPRLVAPPAGRRHWTRTAVHDHLLAALQAGGRLLVGFDFAFSVAREAGLGATAFEVWDTVEQASGDAADFFAGAAVLHPRCGGLFWTRGRMPAGWAPRHRLTERACAARPESVFKLIGSKQVGKASLAGMRVLRSLRAQAGDRLAIWPFEPVAGRSVATEIFPTIFRKEATGKLAKIVARDALDRALAHYGSGCPRGLPATVTDHEGDALLSAAALRFHVSRGAAMPAVPRGVAASEGWIFGVAA